MSNIGLSYLGQSTYHGVATLSQSGTAIGNIDRQPRKHVIIVNDQSLVLHSFSQSMENELVIEVGKKRLRAKHDRWQPGAQNLHRSDEQL